MKIKSKKIVSLIFIAISLLMIFHSNAVAVSDISYDDLPYESYTYWRDLKSDDSKTLVPIQSLYQPSRVVENRDITSMKLEAIEDIYCSDSGNIYILDSALPAIVILDKNYNTTEVITELKNNNGESVSFADSIGLFVTEDEDIYLCGTTNACVWVTDTKGNIKHTLYLPDSDIIPDSFTYSPMKVAVDSKGYTYVLSRGSYYGTVLYSPSGDFLGFYGANSVNTSVSSVLSNIWSNLFLNDDKKSAMVKQLPFQITDLDIGINDFVYTTTGNTNTKGSGQIRILNPAGDNIIDNSKFDFSDGVAVKLSKQQWIDQNISQITVVGNYIYVLDTGHGKVFLYDRETNLLGVFGGGMKQGTQKGMFEKPVAIAVNGDDVIIADSKKCSLTIYTITEYGKLVLECQDLTLASKYLEAKEGWEQVISIDKNFQLAYRGLAKASLREKNYKDAMQFAKISADRDTYSEAYSFYRKDFIVNNFYWIIIALLTIIALIVFIVIKLKKNNKSDNAVHHLFYTMQHPFYGFGEVIEKKRGSCIAGICIIIVYYISQVLKETYSGFSFSYFDPVSFNSLYILVKTIGFVILWTFVNWAVCTLFGGLGSIRNIFIVITYSLLPLILSNVLYLILSNVITDSELALLNIIVSIAWLYTVFLLIVGTIKIHDFSFGKFLGTSILTIIGILIVIFLLFIIFILIQQLVSFLVTLVNELIYR